VLQLVKTITDYIENVRTVIEGIPRENIFNFDETNFTDNPGQKSHSSPWCQIPRENMQFFKKQHVCNGVQKRRWQNCTAVCSLQIFPVVEHMDGRGPCWLSVSPHAVGVVRLDNVNDWFESIVIPALRKLYWKKVIVCDNLSTHLSVPIFQRCREENIHFVCLPPNSTHLTQPLAVSFFRPLRAAWHNNLAEWKQTPDGMKDTVLPKQDFPYVLSEESYGSVATQHKSKSDKLFQEMWNRPLRHSATA
jgi:hypothetical protein